MRKTILTFGLISGAISASMLVMMLPFTNNESYVHSEIFGWTIIILSMLLVFFGIRSYRENVGGGAITFGKAFKVGILIVLVSSAIYVVSWEIVYYNFMPDFGEKYAAKMVEAMKKQGASQQVLDAKAAEMKSWAEMYKNPFINAGLTFVMEPLPPGLIISLISAAILRKKPSTANI